MTLVRMLETRKGSEDGFTVKQFMEGQVYDIRENLARSFFAAGFAVMEKVIKTKKHTTSRTNKNRRKK